MPAWVTNGARLHMREASDLDEKVSSLAPESFEQFGSIQLPQHMLPATDRRTKLRPRDVGRLLSNSIVGEALSSHAGFWRKADHLRLLCGAEDDRWSVDSSRRFVVLKYVHICDIFSSWRVRLWPQGWAFANFATILQS
jgi:hypothetical protein